MKLFSQPIHSLLGAADSDDVRGSIFVVCGARGPFRRSMPAPRCALLLRLMLVSLISSVSVEAQIGIDQFQREILPAWRSLREDVETIQGEVYITNTTYAPKKLTQRHIVRFANVDGFRKIELISVKTKRPYCILAFNDEYQFMLEPKSESVDWGSTFTTADGNMTVSDYQRAGTEDRGGGAYSVYGFDRIYPLLGISAIGTPLDAAFDEGRLSIRLVDPLDSTHVEITGSIQSPSDRDFVSEFRVVANRARRWRIEEAMLIHPGGGTTRRAHQSWYQHRTTEFSSALSGAYPKSSTAKTGFVNGGLIEQEEAEFGRPSVCQQPLESFTLPHYGINPPPLGPLPSSLGKRLRPWQVSLAACLLFLTGVLAWNRFQLRRA